LHEVLRGIRERKRAYSIDGIYSILGLLPYGDKIKLEYRKDNVYSLEYLQKELLRIMNEAAREGYLEYLS